MSGADGQSKAALRRRMAAALSVMSGDEVRAESARAWGRALAAGLFPMGSAVMLYAPIAGVAEIDLTGLAVELGGQGSRLCVPRIDGATRGMAAARVANLTTDLVPDTASRLKGMLMARPDAPEIPGEELDVVVVPGVAFDRTGARLGRGAGFYDRFLGRLKGGRPRRVAIAFDAQVVERVPTEAHDERVEVIVTPTEIIEVR